MRMFFKPMAKLALAVLIASVAPSAFAAKSLDLDAIRTQQAEIRQGIEARTGRYASLSADKRTALLVKQTNLMKTLEGKTTADDLSEHQRVEVFNTLEWIEAAINGTEGEELICRREKTIGSTRLTRVCRTAAEEARMKEEARRRMLEGSIDGSR